MGSVGGLGAMIFVDGDFRDVASNGMFDRGFPYVVLCLERCVRVVEDVGFLVKVGGDGALESRGDAFCEIVGEILGYECFFWCGGVDMPERGRGEVEALDGVI